ncbi:hypothetical protein Slin15195_G066120 [Septoria linicola]|uniref:Uncharacterized protein n=1 Tax=Septoria linicola TaxID=215465 RepID=A0A9Q9AWC0_9PEZI|nr:hypothetical protein Slin15195_G066120 [Septoria linicola]
MTAPSTRPSTPRHRQPHQRSSRAKTAPPPAKNKAEKVLEVIPCGIGIAMIVIGVGHGVHKLVKCCFVGTEQEGENIPLAQAAKKPKKKVRFACDEQMIPSPFADKSPPPLFPSSALPSRRRASAPPVLESTPVAPRNSAGRSAAALPSSKTAGMKGGEQNGEGIPWPTVRHVGAFNDLCRASHTPSITLTPPDSTMAADTEELRRHMKRRLTVRDENGELRAGLPVQRKLSAHFRRDLNTPGLYHIRPDRFADESASIIRDMPEPGTPRILAMDKLADCVGLEPLSNERE